MQLTKNGEEKMNRNDFYSEYRDELEYHGSTSIRRVRVSRGRVLFKDWLHFDSVEEALEYFCENND